MEERLLKLEDRLLKLLDTEQLSSSKFADVIGVQRSSVSHILTGRNKPSFDFLQKTLKAFPMLNADWLILSEGEMYEGEHGPGGGSLFDQPSVARAIHSERDVRNKDQSSYGSSSAVSESSPTVSGGDIPGARGHGNVNSPSGAVQQQAQQVQQQVQQQAQPQDQQVQSQDQQVQHQVQQQPEQGKKGPGAVREQSANDPGAATDSSGTSAPVTPLPGANVRGRKVSRVILFYDDNSFETFEPA